MERGWLTWPILREKLWTETFRHVTPSSEINNAVDGASLLFAPTTRDASDSIHKAQEDIVLVNCS